MSVLNVDELFINSNLNIPSVTESQRDAMTKIIGMVIYNSTTGQFEVWTGDPDSDVDADYGVGWISSPGPELYTFSSVTFTPGGQSGRDGPSLTQIRNGISGNSNWKSDTNFLNSSNGVITWAVPKDGNYVIEAWGAQGGRSNCYGPNGGQGARVRGTFSFNQGDTLKMVVGQRGSNQCYDCGGGGASYVCTSANQALLVAAGGGGGSASGMSGPGPFHGRTSNQGGSTSWATGGGPNAGGGGMTAGGGGGVSTNGGGSWYGRSFSNGSQGGPGPAPGGFGGGGGGGQTNGAGGGGGYGGGGASYWSFYGAGGGSYNGGTSQSNSDNNNANDGKISITFSG